MMNVIRVETRLRTDRAPSRNYRQVKPRLQWISMRVQTVGEDRYSPWPRAPSSEAVECGARARIEESPRYNTKVEPICTLEPFTPVGLLLHWCSSVCGQQNLLLSLGPSKQSIAGNVRSDDPTGSLARGAARVFHNFGCFARPLAVGDGEPRQHLLRQSSARHYQFRPHSDPQEWTEVGNHVYQHQHEPFRLQRDQHLSGKSSHFGGGR